MIRKACRGRGLIRRGENDAYTYIYSDKSLSRGNAAAFAVCPP